MFPINYLDCGDYIVVMLLSVVAELLLLCIRRSQLRVMGFGCSLDAPRGGNPGILNWEETPGHTNDMLEGLSISCGLQTAGDLPGSVDIHGRGDGHHSYFAFATSSKISVMDKQTFDSQT